MELVNHSPVAAHVRISDLEGTPHRYGFLTAKATFVVEDHGRVRIDGQRPFPLFEADQETEHGLLPSDAVPRRDPTFEVIVLGPARASGPNQTQQLVELTLAGHRRSLLVTGDRYWLPGLLGARGRISAAAPYETMPLTWDRAYGGSCECWIDGASAIDIDHRMNKLGRGFDAEKLARDLGQAFESPPGFPRLPPEYIRWLPNVEHPLAPVRNWDDDPPPYCWATVPLDIGVHLQRAFDSFVARHQPPLSQREMLRVANHRAHPDWLIDLPPIDAPITLRGMSSPEPWCFRLPRLRIFADYELGARTGTRELQPQLLLLLPAQSRFYLVYRHFFTIESTTSDMVRSFRLRMAEGWFEK